MNYVKVQHGSFHLKGHTSGPGHQGFICVDLRESTPQ